jgi:competence ComEA-like helix-hairpin-helix protein
MDNPLDVQIASLMRQKEQKILPQRERAFKSQTRSVKGQKQETFSYKIPKEPFDPNTYTFEDWKAIGFSDKQVQTIINYQENGGGFKVKEDVKKLYVVDEDLYSDLYEFIDLPETILVSENQNFDNNESQNKNIILNINTATEEELREVSGIGPFFAKQILELRGEYGGIHDLNQLLEIYRMDEEKLAKLKGSLVIEGSDITKINLNKATRKELSQHKNISWNIANSIVSMRETHGDYKKIDDLLKSVLIDQEKLEILRPYLIIE